jgi:hypothetical protein
VRLFWTSVKPIEMKQNMDGRLSSTLSAYPMPDAIRSKNLKRSAEDLIVLWTCTSMSALTTLPSVWESSRRRFPWMKSLQRALAYMQNNAAPLKTLSQTFPCSRTQCDRLTSETVNDSACLTLPGKLSTTAPKHLWLTVRSCSSGKWKEFLQKVTASGSDLSRLVECPVLVSVFKTCKNLVQTSAKNNLADSTCSAWK